MQSAQQDWIIKNITVTVEFLTISVDHYNTDLFFFLFSFFF